MSSETKLALFATMQAKPGKESEVAAFLQSAVSMVQAETGTLDWYALQFTADTFGIFDTFSDEKGRDAHLNGEVAKALMQKAPDLFAAGPEIKKLEILATK